MTDLYINKLNESYIQIRGEPHIIEELSDAFTFYAPNYMHSPKFKKRQWDGKIRLFKKRGNLLYAGLKHRVDEWAKEAGYTTDIEWPCNALSPFGWDKYVKRFNLPAKLTPREDQLDLFRQCKEQHRAVVLSPTGSGKSLLIYMLTLDAGMQEYSFDQRTLIVCPTTNLVNQMANDFSEYGCDKNNIKKIWEGVDPLSNQLYPIVISTWQSLINLPEVWFEQFKQVIVDEAHGAAADSLVKVVTACTRAPYRYGFTGTLQDTKCHLLTLEGLFGRIIEGPTTRELIDKEILSDVMINCMVIEYSDEERDRMKKATYQDEVLFLTDHEGRNRYVESLVESCEGSTFALCRLIDRHAKLLYSNLLANDAIEANRSNRAARPERYLLVYGDTKIEDREIARIQANLMDNSIVVASYGVFSGGVNVPNLRNVVFASPYKSKIKVLQSIGRALRRTETKKHADIYDVVDDLGPDSYSMKHFLARIKYYNQQMLPYKITKVKL